MPRRICPLAAIALLPISAPAQDPQVEALIEAIGDRTVGLLTNPTGVDENLTPIGDILFADPPQRSVDTNRRVHEQVPHRQEGILVEREAARVRHHVANEGELREHPRGAQLTGGA